MTFVFDWSVEFLLWRPLLWLMSWEILGTSTKTLASMCLGKPFINSYWILSCKIVILLTVFDKLYWKYLMSAFHHISSPPCSSFGLYSLQGLNTYFEFTRGHKGWILYTFLSSRLEKGILFHVKKLENHIPGVPKSWKTVLKISGNHGNAE